MKLCTEKVFVNQLVCFKVLFMPDLPKTYMYIRKDKIQALDFGEKQFQLKRKGKYIKSNTHQNFKLIFFCVTEYIS